MPDGAAGFAQQSMQTREQAARSVAERLVKHGGAAIFIDYGHERSGHGDTLQAMRSHRFAPALTDPGEQDLTAHVDFEAVVKAVREAGADATRLSPQCEWLRRLGIEARASDLSQRNPARADDINAALDRLTTGDAMGDLFKVIAIHAPDWPPPAGFE